MMMQRTMIYGVTLILGACAAKPVSDDSPKNPSAVLQAKYVINGIVLPDAHGTQMVYTREDRRRIDNKNEFDSWIARMTIGNFATRDVARLDRNLVWFIKDKDKTYIECPLTGCRPKYLQELLNLGEDSDTASYDPENTPGCQATMTKNEVKVHETGQTRVMAGYNVRQFVALWRIEFEDAQKRRDVNTLRFEFWTTEPTATMQEVWKVHDSFQRGYLQRIGADSNPLARFLSQEVYMALAAFSGDVSKDKPWRSAVNREFNKVQGYPLSIKLEWTADSKACPAETQSAGEQKKKSSDPLGFIKDAVSDFAGKQIKKQFMPKPGEPVLRYIYDVTSVQLQPEHDSVFEIPVGYKMINRN